MRAIWNGTVIAESDDTVVVEGNHYFPTDALDRTLLVPRTPARRRTLRRSICLPMMPA